MKWQDGDTTSVFDSGRSGRILVTNIPRYIERWVIDPKPGWYAVYLYSGTTQPGAAVESLGYTGPYQSRQSAKTQGMKRFRKWWEPVKANPARRNPGKVTLADVPMGEHHVGDFHFTFAPSRWSKGNVAVLTSESDYRSKGLLREFNPTYSHRAGYTLAPSKALKLLAVARAGGEYVSPAELRKKKAEARFEEEAKKAILSFGARPGGALGYQYTVQTPAGPLGLSAHGGFIAGRFEDVQQAKTIGSIALALGPWNNGKWNFHGESAIADFKRALTRLLAKSNPKKR